MLTALKSGEGLPNEKRAKHKRVQTWAENFVGKATMSSDKGKGRKMEEELPPDTQSFTNYA